MDINGIIHCGEATVKQWKSHLLEMQLRNEVYLSSCNMQKAFTEYMWGKKGKQRYIS